MAGGKSRKSGGVSKALINQIVSKRKRRAKAEEMSAKELVPITLETPSIPANWDYDESVGKIRTFVYKWKNLTVKIANELYIARELLSAQGTRTDLTSDGNVRSWTQYCEDIGTSRQRVNEWLVRWFGHRAYEPLWPDEKPDDEIERTKIINELKYNFNRSLQNFYLNELTVLKDNWNDGKEWWYELCDKMYEESKKREEKEQQRNRKTAAV